MSSIIGFIDRVTAFIAIDTALACEIGTYAALAYESVLANPPPLFPGRDKISSLNLKDLIYSAGDNLKIAANSLYTRGRECCQLLAGQYRDADPKYTYGHRFFVEGAILAAICGLVTARIFPGPSLAVGAAFSTVNYGLIMLAASQIDHEELETTKKIKMATMCISVITFITGAFFKTVLKAPVTSKMAGYLGIASAIGAYMSDRLKTQAKRL